MKYPWKYILVSLVIGLLLGGAAGLFYSRGPGAHRPKKGAEMFLRHLDRELRLSEPQKTQIRTLLEANHKKMAVARAEIRKHTQADIRALLTPEQQGRFDALEATFEAERQRRRAS